MKTGYAAVIGILAFLLSACVTGDEITSYVIDPDGAIAFSIYRLNLTSDQSGEDAKKELANYIQELEEMRGDFFMNLVKANAREVNTATLRKASPSSVVITGHIPSLNDFAAYLSDEDENRSLVCTPISRERTRGILCKLTRKPIKEKFQPETRNSRADSFGEVRISLAAGIFTKAQGFTLSDNKQSALLDTDALLRRRNAQSPSIPISLEWQIPEAP